MSQHSDHIRFHREQREVGKHPALAEPYSQLKSPRYPSAAEQRTRLANARAKWIARVFLATLAIASGFYIAVNDTTVLWFAGAGAIGFITMCLLNFKHNEPRDPYSEIADNICARYLTMERRFLLLAFLSGLLLLGLLAYVVVY